MHKLQTTQTADGLAQLTDAELAARSTQGNALAFQHIMRRHNRLLFRTARSNLKNDEEAQDALQQAYLRAWRSLGTFRAESRLSTWLVRIVADEALGRLRRRGSAHVIPIDTALETIDAREGTWMHADPGRPGCLRACEPRRDQLRLERQWIGGAPDGGTAAIGNQDSDDPHTVPRRGGRADGPVGGQIQLFFDAASGSINAGTSGKVRLIGVAGTRRLPVLPELPTFAEQGIANFTGSTWAAHPGSPTILAAAAQ